MGIELLIGVQHEREFLQAAFDLLEERVPPTTKSMMLELPTFHDDEKERIDREFFHPIAQRYRQRGVEIIYGDVNRRPVSDLTKRALTRISHGTERFTDYGIQIASNFWFVAASLLDALVFHRRDRGMLKTAREKQPEVIVLGIAHAEYLKKKLPDVHYIGVQHEEGERKRFCKFLNPNHGLCDEVVSWSHIPLNPYKIMI